jgi:hypothetical protein
MAELVARPVGPIWSVTSGSRRGSQSRRRLLDPPPAPRRGPEAGVTTVEGSDAAPVPTPLAAVPVKV